MANEKQTIKSYCNNCRSETNHEYIFSESFTKAEIKDRFFKSKPKLENWSLLKCCGCEKIKVKKENKEIGDTSVSCLWFPPDELKQLEQWVENLPKNIMMVYRETVSAFNNSFNTLATQGIRTVLDIMFVEKVGDIGSFQKKLKKMEEDRHIVSVR